MGFAAGASGARGRSAAVPWAVAKLLWAATLLFAAWAVTKLPGLFLRPGQVAPPTTGFWQFLPIVLVFNTMTITIVLVGQTTLVFLAAPEDKAAGVANKAPLLELTYNYDPEVYTGGRNFGHLAYEVDDIYAACRRLQEHGVTINRPPRDGRMAFVRSPDNISIELLQAGTPLAPAEPWASMANTGSW